MTESTTGKKARDLFNSGWYCAESVVRSLMELDGADATEMVRGLSGMCSGVGRTKGMCGALTGAIVGMGYFAGRTSPEENMDFIYALTGEMVDLFRERWGSLGCMELTGCDFSTAEGQRRFKDENIGQKCRDIASFAAGTAEALLRENGVLPGSGAGREELLRKFAPCGLNCGKCVAFKGGEIARLSKRLHDLLGPNFAGYAGRFAEFDPVFKNYGSFQDMLEYFADAKCDGCRGKECLFHSCHVTKCVRERGVDYCFQCSDFPCKDSGFPPLLEQRWRENNIAMRESGLDEFVRKNVTKHRYP